MTNIAPVKTQDQTTGQLSLPSGTPPLRSIYVYVADACNLACRHCYIAPRYLSVDKVNLAQQSDSFVKIEYIEKAIHEALPLGLQNIKLTGGEPTLHPHYRDILDLISGEGLAVNVETNGTLIDESLAEHMRERNVFHVSVSLDGATPDTHDYLRAIPGSFEAAIKGIQALVKAGFAPQVICTLHHNNMHEAHDVIALGQELGAGSVKFNFVQRMGRGERLSDDIGMSVPEIINFCAWIDHDVAPSCPIPIFTDIPTAFYSLRRLNYELIGLCTVLNILGLLANGSLSLCGVGVQRAELVYGNIMADSVDDVWLRNTELVKLRQLIPSQLKGICSECVHRDRCRGHCIAHNFHRTGELNAAYHFCHTADELGLFPGSRKVSLE